MGFACCEKGLEQPGSANSPRSRPAPKGAEIVRSPGERATASYARLARDIVRAAAALIGACFGIDHDLPRQFCRPDAGPAVTRRRAATHPDCAAPHSRRPRPGQAVSDGLDAGIPAQSAEGLPCRGCPCLATPACMEIGPARVPDRLDLFLATANRTGVPHNAAEKASLMPRCL